MMPSSPGSRLPKDDDTIEPTMIVYAIKQSPTAEPFRPERPFPPAQGEALVKVFTKCPPTLKGSFTSHLTRDKPWYHAPMRFRKLRIAWSVAWGVVAVLLMRVVGAELCHSAIPRFGREIITE